MHKSSVSCRIPKDGGRERGLNVEGKIKREVQRDTDRGRGQHTHKHTERKREREIESCVCRCVESRKGSLCPGAELIGSCQLPYVGARN